MNTAFRYSTNLFFRNYLTMTKGFSFGTSLSVFKNLKIDMLKRLYHLIMGGFLRSLAVLMITTHKRKRIKMKVHKTWKRWKEIKNTKKNLKK
jgi:hypothetical protein